MGSVYALGDPRIQHLIQQVRYVGIAEDIHRRYAQHLLYPHKNEAKNEWMQDLKANGLLPTLIILEANVDAADILERERYWIAYYLEQGASLTNIVVPGTRKKPKYIQYPPQKVEETPVQESIDIPPSEQEHEPQIYTLEDIAARLQISERTVYRFIKDGEMDAYKDGRIWRIREEDLDAYIQLQRDKVEAQFRARAS